jgi:hypothetical protein
MADGQSADVCPRCGSTASVHSIEELLAQAQSRLNDQRETGSQRGRGESGGSDGQQSGPAPGWAQEPTSGPVQGGWQGGGWQGSGYRDYGESGPLGDDLAGLAMGAATRFLGRAIGRRVERAMTEKILPALQASRQQALATQTAIAQRYPDLRACMTDKVIFLAGGSRTAAMDNVNFSAITLDQADALVASLLDG